MESPGTPLPEPGPGAPGPHTDRTGQPDPFQPATRPYRRRGAATAALPGARRFAVGRRSEPGILALLTRTLATLPLLDRRHLYAITRSRPSMRSTGSCHSSRARAGRTGSTSPRSMTRRYKPSSGHTRLRIRRRGPPRRDAARDRVRRVTRSSSRSSYAPPRKRRCCGRATARTGAGPDLERRRDGDAPRCRRCSSRP